MRKLHNSYPSGDCFFFFLLPSFLPFQKLLVTPKTLLHYSHTYIGAIIQSTEHTDTTVCHDVTRFRLTSAEGPVQDWSWRQIRKLGSKQELLCPWWPRDITVSPCAPDNRANITCLQQFVFLRSCHCILSSCTKPRQNMVRILEKTVPLEIKT